MRRGHVVVIRDGLDAAPDPHGYAKRGWLPISTAQPAIRCQYRRERDGTLRALPSVIEGRTVTGQIVEARYYADGSYTDRWTDKNCKVEYRLTHWRKPLARITA